MSIIVLSYLFSNLYDGLKLGKEPVNEPLNSKPVCPLVPDSWRSSA